MRQNRTVWLTVGAGPERVRLGGLTLWNCKGVNVFKFFGAGEIAQR